MDEASQLLRLRYKKEIDRSELEKLKFKIGDLVLFENTKYVLTQIGLRFVYGVPADKPNSQPAMLYIKNLLRWEEPDAEENYQPDIEITNDAP